MTVSELISELSQYDPSLEVMILDGFNGSGTPREINLGPVTQLISEEDGQESADCEWMVGDEVVIMGYGCY
jgi:hypothetical protein